MRKRILLAASAFAVTASAGGVAAAQPAGEDPAPWTAPAPEAAEVVLPTGDTVALAADGTLDLGAGEAFSVTRAADGDRLVVPLDAVDEVAAGEYDAAAFNVDDPGSAPETEDEDEDEAETPANVALTGLWRDGTGADVIAASWIELDTGEHGGPDFTEGKRAELALEPGRYHLVVMLHRTNDEGETDTIVAIKEIRVGEDPVEVLVDGTRSKPLGFDLDREAELRGVMLDVFSYPPGVEEDGGAWAGVWDFPGGDLYAIPTRRLSGDHNVGYVLREGLSSPEGTADPYSYNLFRAETDGIRGDLTPRVRDRDLARIDADYQTLGAEGVLERQDRSDHPDWDAWAWSPTGPVALPSARTEFYTADEDLTWSHRGHFPYEGGPGSPWDLVHHRGGVLEPGSVQDMSWNNAPLSVGLDNIGGTWPPATVSRWEELGGFYAAPWMFSTAAGGEGVHSEYLPGKITLAQGGEILAQNSEIGVGLPLSDLRPGPLTLTAVAERQAPWTPLGTRSAAEWTFDYDPAGNPVMPVSVVELTVPGVVDGAAEAGTVQQVGLEFATQPGADDQECAAMTFEVSFDDGATWTAVPIDRDGDTAAAALELPADAAFASVRFTAADANGNTVAHETIRSFAIA